LYKAIFRNRRKRSSERKGEEKACNKNEHKEE
jgi:hypothetical protein